MTEEETPRTDAPEHAIDGKLDRFLGHRDIVCSNEDCDCESIDLWANEGVSCAKKVCPACGNEEQI